MGWRLGVQFARAIAMLAVCAPARAGTSYFLVAEKPGQVFHHDSFVLPLTQSADVSHARDLIAEGPDKAGASIVVADIAAGADGINRDLLSSNQRPWSWHITQFKNFADFGIEILDGWPSFVEQDVPGWIKNTRGSIGFWNYTVVRELKDYPSQPPTGQPPSVPLPPATGQAAVLLTLIAGCAAIRKSIRIA